MKNFYSLIIIMLISSSGIGQEITAISGRQSSQATTVANLSANALSRGPGINSTGTSTFNSNGWTTSSSIDLDDYIEWSVTAGSGFTTTITSIEIDYDRSNTGPTNVSIRTSLDGFNSDIFTDNSVSNSGEIVNFNTSLSSTDGGTITFRLYAYNANAAGGTFDIESNNLGTVLGQDQTGIILRGSVDGAGSGCSSPSTQASLYNTPSITATNATLNWTRGNGDNVLVVMREASAIDTDPTNGNSYMGNTSFSTGDQIGVGNYVVFNGSGTSVNVNGLVTSTTYHVAIYEYNTIDTCYNNTELVGSFTTDCTIPTDVSAFTAVGNDTTIDLSWTNGTCFDEILVIAKEASAVTATPIGDGSAYTGNSVFGSGTDLGSSEYVVYKGVGTSATVTSLTNGITYHFEVFARKGTSWSSGIIANATSNNILITGSLIITEIMNDPSDLEPEGEYFEIYNPGTNPIDMNGWVISDNDSDAHTITTSLIVPPNGFIVLGNNSDTGINGNVILDYVYGGGIALANGADEIILTDGSATEIDRVEYDTGALWPNPQGTNSEGFAMIYIGSDIEDNNDGSLWIAATVSEGLNPDFGSPGSNGTNQIVAYLVFSSGAWTTVPSPSTGSRTGLIKSDETTSFTSDVSLNDLIIEEGADLTIDSGITFTVNDITLKSISTSYSSLIRNGTITGTVHYERFVNQISSGSPGNDLVSIPLTDFDLNFQSFLDFGSPTTNRDVLATDPGNTVHAFGPYDNTGLSYVNYPTYSPALPPDPAAEPLISGKGYRAASTAGANITFTGNVLSNDISIDITTPTAVINSQWNLIGNPYPSYLDANKFLLANGTPMEDSAEAIYAYNSATYTGGAATTGNFTIINLATIAAFPAENFNIAPGQGFFVPADITPGFTGTINFITGPTATDDMRTTSGADDYIVGRSTDITYALKLSLTDNNEVATSFFFNDNASRGLDPGYDAATFGGSNIFSHLVENNTGQPMALQALSLNDMSDVTIPLGINANQGEQITFSISLTTLPEAIDVYLEDNVTNTITLLNNSDYVLTPLTDLNGTGRFFLRFSNTTLSNSETSLDSINIYANQSNKTIIVEGQISENSEVKIYDLQGRLINKTGLSASEQSQSIDVNHLSTGVYVVQLENESQTKTKKVIIK